MKLRLLLTSAAVVCLAWPAAALADPPTDQGQGKQDHARQQPKGGEKQNPVAAGRGNAAPARGAAASAGARAPGQTPGQDRRALQSQRGPGPAPTPPTPAARFGQGGVAGTRQTGPTHAAPSGLGAAAPSRAARGQEPGVATMRAPQRQPPAPSRPSQFQAPNRQALAPRPAPPPLAGWNRNLRGADRDRADQQWRQTYSGWDRNAPWRSNREWWRGDSSFRLFAGPRIGFFFFPDIGYIAAPYQYRDRHWQAGDYLPNWFWQYTVRDYYRYGLPQPPYGCEWVWLNGDVALIDTSDGYILDVVHNVW